MNKTKGTYWAAWTHGGVLLRFGSFADPLEAGRVVEENRRRLIEYEAKRALGETPPFPELIRGRDRRFGRKAPHHDLIVALTKEGKTRKEIALAVGCSSYSVAYAQKAEFGLKWARGYAKRRPWQRGVKRGPYKKRQKAPESFPAPETITEETEVPRELTFVPEGMETDITLEDLFG